MSTDTFGGDCTDAEFGLGDIVEVSRRMWPGMNKQGGIAKITGIHRDNGTSCERTMYLGFHLLLSINFFA